MQDNRCLWLIDEALKSADPQHQKCLGENCGKADKFAEPKSKKSIKNMKFVSVYHEYEKVKVTSLDESEGLKRSIYEGLLNRMYKQTE